MASCVNGTGTTSSDAREGSKKPCRHCTCPRDRCMCRLVPGHENAWGPRCLESVDRGYGMNTLEFTDCWLLLPSRIVIRSKSSEQLCRINLILHPNVLKASSTRP